MVEWITQDTFLEQRVHPSVLMHSLERREQGYFCRFVYEKETIPDKFITRHLATGNFGKG